MSYLYVALGDSLTVGIGASFFSPGFVQRYQGLAINELQEPVYVETYAHPGFQSHDVLLELNNDVVKEQIKNAAIITITAGGNDLIEAARNFQENKKEEDFNIALKNCMENYCRIMKEINVLKNNSISPYIVRLVDLYNPLPENPLAEKWIKKFNSQLKNFVKVPFISVAQIDKVFKGHEREYLSMDGIHPNDQGYEKIGESLHHLGYGELSLGMEEE
ncbi:MAG: GDSL-type esterase/lipase family protein [Bacillota bacterium]|nr:GDSL-type esterase/lipase family protein [Bacillota bacterium]